MAMYSVIAADGSAYGPVDEAALAQWAREGRVNAASQIRFEPGGSVVQAGTLPFLAGVFPPAPQPAQQAWYGLVPAGSPQARMHQLTSFSVAGVVLLQGLFHHVGPHAQRLQDVLDVMAQGRDRLADRRQPLRPHRRLVQPHVVQRQPSLVA